MPFTLSHTAAAILFKPWFNRGKLSITGIVVGCMTPDFEYFLRMKMYGEFGHQAWGIILLDLPLAIIVALLFHLYIRSMLIQHLPVFMTRRLVRYQNLDWLSYFKNHVLVVMISVILGILTHLVWDAATHPSGIWVQQFEFLQQTIHFGHHEFALFKLMQHASSTLGLVLICWSFYRLKPVTVDILRPTFKSLLGYWGSIIVLFMLMLSAWAIFNAAQVTKVGYVIVAMMACGFYSVLVASWAWLYKSRHHN